MTNIDFYVLSDNTLAARDHFACRLAEKAVNMGRQVVISVNDDSHAESMSQYLWSFKPESFFPHSYTHERSYAHHHAGNSSPKENIFIDWQGHTQHHYDVLINLKHSIPQEFSHFQKLSEIVVQEENLLLITRKHFQFYRDRGYPLKSHNIS